MAKKHPSDSETTSTKTNGTAPVNGSARTPLKLGKDNDHAYNKELRRLQIELVKLQEWVRQRA